MPHWLEVTLLVDGELAEAAAEVLSRFAPAGVALEASTIEPDEAEGRPVGPLAVRAYLPADERLEDTRRRLEKALWHLGQITPLPEPQYRSVVEADWAEAWKVHYRPIRVGQRLRVIPAWLAIPLAPDDVPIRLDPGMAFGTGTHPTTQLCLAMLEDYLRPGDHVADLGTGSGILAIAAVKLGAASVMALDIDPEAVRAARTNIAANGVAHAVRVEQGSLARLQSAPSTYAVVLANILAPVIVELLRQGLVDIVQPKGSLIVSGILEPQADEVIGALVEAGLETFSRRQMKDWVATAARRAG